jgi:hypothetical protein
VPYESGREGLHFHGVRQEMNGLVASPRKNSRVIPYARRLRPSNRRALLG